VPQHRQGEGADVLAGDVVASLQEGPRLAGQDQRLAGARAGAPLDLAADHLRRLGAGRARGADQAHGVVDDVVRDRDLPHELLNLADLLAGEDRLDRRLLRSGGAAHHAGLVLRAEVVHHHAGQKTVELRLGQRVGALEFDRVLRRQDEERVVEAVGLTPGGHLALAHRLEQGRLGLRRGAVDLVGEEDVREDRPADEAELAAAAGGVLFHHLGAENVRRHQVGRELDTLELQREEPRDALHQEGLAEARHTDQEAMTARQERHDDLLDHRLLTDDDLAQLRQHAAAGTGDALHGFATLILHATLPR